MTPNPDLEGGARFAPICTGRIKLRGDAGPSGQLSKPKEFIAIDGKYYDVAWVTGAPGLTLEQLELSPVEEVEQLDPIAAMRKWGEHLQDVTLSGRSNADSETMVRRFGQEMQSLANKLEQAELQEELQAELPTSGCRILSSEEQVEKIKRMAKFGSLRKSETLPPLSATMDALKAAGLHPTGEVAETLRKKREEALEQFNAVFQEEMEKAPELSDLYKEPLNGPEPYHQPLEPSKSPDVRNFYPTDMLLIRLQQAKTIMERLGAANWSLSSYKALSDLLFRLELIYKGKQAAELRDQYEADLDYGQSKSHPDWRDDYIEERRRRSYYQGMVYDACNLLDAAAAPGVPALVCGVADAPTGLFHAAMVDMVERASGSVQGPHLSVYVVGPEKYRVDEDDASPGAWGGTYLTPAAAAMAVISWLEDQPLD